jgi:hypothetical protein
MVHAKTSNGSISMSRAIAPAQSTVVECQLPLDRQPRHYLAHRRIGCIRALWFIAILIFRGPPERVVATGRSARWSTVSQVTGRLLTMTLPRQPAVHVHDEPRSAGRCTSPQPFSAREVSDGRGSGNRFCGRRPHLADAPAPPRTKSRGHLAVQGAMGRIGAAPLKGVTSVPAGSRAADRIAASW